LNAAVAPPPTDFDTVADVYDTSLPHHVVEHYLRKRLVYIRRYATAGPVLDVGCGTGVLLERVVDAGHKAVGLDPSRGMLTQLRARRPEIPAVVGDGAALPFPDETFALVYCVAVLHHVAEKKAVRQTLAEMSRVTRRGGHILVWDHNPANPYWPWLMRRVPQDTGGERLIPTDEIVGGLTAGGARPIACRQLGFVADFTPPRLLGAAESAERLIEAVPIVRRLCAHNVILAVKDGNKQS
jgi:SAM-dependent methyltransferase